MTMPTPIELAPNWKRSLTQTNPVILASGVASPPTPSVPLPPLLALKFAPGEGGGGRGRGVRGEVGAIVTLPVTMNPRVGAPLPRVVEISGGVMLRTGAANPGLPRLLRDNARAWASSPLPIIVAFAAQGARDWPAMTARLERVPGVGGIELHLNPTIDAADAIRAVRAATELPILAQLDLDHAVEIAAECVAAGANALGIGRAPRGMIMREGRPWYGRLYSPVVKPLALRAVSGVAGLNLGVPLVGCGGVHSADDVREFLAAGAIAVEIDSAAWVDPQVIDKIVRELGVEV